MHTHIAVRRRAWVSKYISQSRIGLKRPERLVASGLGLFAAQDGTVSITHDDLAEERSALGLSAEEYQEALDTLARRGWITSPCWSLGGVMFALACPADGGGQ